MYLRLCIYSLVFKTFYLTLRMISLSLAENKAILYRVLFGETFLCL
jgi:hypothetical protein